MSIEFLLYILLTLASAPKDEPHALIAPPGATEPPMQLVREESGSYVLMNRKGKYAGKPFVQIQPVNAQAGRFEITFWQDPTSDVKRLQSVDLSEVVIMDDSTDLATAETLQVRFGKEEPKTLSIERTETGAVFRLEQPDGSDGPPWTVTFQKTRPELLVSPDEADTTPPDLEKALDEMIELLEAGEIGTFFDKRLHPADRERVLEKISRDAIIEKFKSGPASQLLEALRRARHQTPVLHNNGATAVYTWPEGKPVKLTKTEGVWYLRN